MGLPSNWQVPKERTTSELTTLPFVLLGLAASVLVCRAIFQESTRLWLPPESFLSGAPHPNKLAFFLLLQGGYLLSLVLLLIPVRAVRYLAIGIVLGTSIAHFGVEGLSAVAWSIESLWGFKFEMAWMKGVYPLLWFYVAAQFWLLVTAIIWIVTEKPRKWPFLFGGAILGSIVFSQSVELRQASWKNFQTYVSEKRREFQAGHDTIQAVGWCAIEYRARKPESGYPRSLEEIADDRACIKPWSLSGQPDYTFNYLPKLGTNGNVEWFFAQAVFKSDPQFESANYGIDPSGILLVLSPTDPGQLGWNRIADSSVAGHIRSLQGCLDRFAADHPKNGFAKHLAEVSKCSEFLRTSRESLPDTFITKNYVFTYSAVDAGSAQPIRSYMLDTRCQVYGRSCIRSYYADPEKVTATTDNRAAKPTDPDAFDCELQSFGMLGGCRQ
jgi:hypothetical protein